MTIPHVFLHAYWSDPLLVAYAICNFLTPERRPGREAILKTPGKLEEVLEVQPVENWIKIFLSYNMTQCGCWLSKLTWFGWKLVKERMEARLDSSLSGRGRLVEKDPKFSFYGKFIEFYGLWYLAMKFLNSTKLSLPWLERSYLNIRTQLELEHN